MIDLTAIGALLTIAAAAVVTVLAQIQKSRCKTINLCGLIRCNRELPDIEPADDNPNIQKWIDKK